jgi:hypothetical protein
MGFYDAFFGSEQSQYTAYAIVAAIIAICITILLTATDVPISNRLLIIFFVIISLVPSVFLTLFELTCIVTGGTEPNHWWCHAFAWVLAAFIIIYCIFIVIISLISLFTYNNAIDNVKMNEDNNRLSPEVSNDYAKQMIKNDEIKTKQIEKFYQDQMSEKSSYTNVIKPLSIIMPQGDTFESGSGANHNSPAPTNFGDNNTTEMQQSLPQIPSLPSMPSILSMPSMPSMTSMTSMTSPPTKKSEDDVIGASLSSGTTANFANFGDNLNSNELFSSSFSLL